MSFNTQSSHHCAQRRGAVVCHTSFRPKKCDDKSDRKYKRRYANCGSPCILQNAQIVARAAAKCPTLLVVPLTMDVIFDKTGMPIPNHDGTSNFSQRILFEFHDKYKVAHNPTHKSIVANRIMNELMSENCSKFYDVASPSVGYIELNNEQLYRRIKKALDRVQETSSSSSRRKRSILARCA